MQHDPLADAHRLGLGRVADEFPDAVREAAAAAARMKAGFRRDLAPAAEPSLVLPPPAPR